MNSQQRRRRERLQSSGLKHFERRQCRSDSHDISKLLIERFMVLCLYVNYVKTGSREESTREEYFYFPLVTVFKLQVCGLTYRFS